MVICVILYSKYKNQNRRQNIQIRQNTSTENYSVKLIDISLEEAIKLWYEALKKETIDQVMRYKYYENIGLMFYNELLVKPYLINAMIISPKFPRHYLLKHFILKSIRIYLIHYIKLKRKFKIA